MHQNIFTVPWMPSKNTPKMVRFPVTQPSGALELPKTMGTKPARKDTKNAYNFYTCSKTLLRSLGVRQQDQQGMKYKYQYPWNWQKPTMSCNVRIIFWGLGGIRSRYFTMQLSSAWRVVKTNETLLPFGNSGFACDLVIGMKISIVTGDFFSGCDCFSTVAMNWWCNFVHYTIIVCNKHSS